MIVVAIIGILASVALPAYQDYTVRSNAAAALAEITPGKIGIELAINEGRVPSLTAADAGFIGILADTSYCAVTLEGTAPNPTGIKCTAKGGNATNFNTKTLTLSRGVSTGEWTCTTDLDAKYKPGKCS